MLYQISHADVTLGGDVILQDINFEVRNTEKIAVVGRNGAGKTTLLRLISGELETDESEVSASFISKNGNIQTGYLKQIAFDDTSVTLEDEIRRAFAGMDARKAELAGAAAALETDHSAENVERYIRLEESFRNDGGYYYEKEIDVLISKFGFTDEERKKPLSDFSGGQQTKIAFIKLLLSKPDILLLDEPTNHLDITTIEWLEGYLKNYPRAVIIVSHDRMFLDNIVDVVYEIEYGNATRYPGNYTNYMARKQENYDKLMKDYAAQQKEIERLQRLVDKFKSHPTKVSMARSKEKAISHMVKIEAPGRFDTKTFHADFQPERESGKDVLAVTDLAIGYPGNAPLSVISADIKRGEKLGVIGGNGLGKSTFLKTIAGQIPPLSGSYRFGVNVKTGYFDQQMAMYSNDKTVLDDFWDEFPRLTETEARTALGAFLFTGDDVFKRIDMLSGGEKVRLALCKIFRNRPNVLILDEPTNHMDIIGKETLEGMLRDYSGTLIFVSHDRYLVKKVSGRLLVFEDGGSHMYQFGYEEYQEKLDRQNAGENTAGKSLFFGGAISRKGNAADTEKKQAANGTGVSPVDADAPHLPGQENTGSPSGGKSAAASFALGKERSRLEKKIKKAETEIENLEKQTAALKAEIENPENQSRYEKLLELQAQLEEAEAESLDKLEEWETLNSRLEELERQ